MMMISDCEQENGLYLDVKFKMWSDKRKHILHFIMWIVL